MRSPHHEVGAHLLQHRRRWGRLPPVGPVTAAPCRIDAELGHLVLTGERDGTRRAHGRQDQQVAVGFHPSGDSPLHGDSVVNVDVGVDHCDLFHDADGSERLPHRAVGVLSCRLTQCHDGVHPTAAAARDGDLAHAGHDLAQSAFHHCRDGHRAYQDVLGRIAGKDRLEQCRILAS